MDPLCTVQVRKSNRNDFRRYRFTNFVRVFKKKIFEGRPVQ